MRENSRFECLANIRCKKENRAYSIKMVVLFQNPSEIDDFRGVFLFFGYRGAEFEIVILSISAVLVCFGGAAKCAEVRSPVLPLLTPQAADNRQLSAASRSSISGRKSLYCVS